MEFHLVDSQNLTLLSQVLNALKLKYPGHSTLEQNFYRALPSNNEKPFAIATQGG